MSANSIEKWLRKKEISATEPGGENIHTSDSDENVLASNSVCKKINRLKVGEKSGLNKKKISSTETTYILDSDENEAVLDSAGIKLSKLKDGEKRSARLGKYALALHKNNPLFKDWIEEMNSHSTDKKVRCKYCKCFLIAKKSILVQHQNSKRHRDASSYLNLSVHSKPFYCTKTSEEQQINELKLSLFTACHTSINAVTHLSDILRSINSDSTKTLSLSRTKCTAVIKNVIAPNFQKQLKEDIGNSSFSLIIDESTDISDKKYLGIVIRYFSFQRTESVTTFLKLVALKDYIASGIADGIKNTIMEFGLSLKNFCGLGTDNASVMVGVNNGVFQKLKTEIPHLILVPCVCHSLQLAVSAVAEKTLEAEIEYIINETYNWFSHSFVRQTAYAQVYSVINDEKNPRKIVRSCKTRWMSIYNSIERITDQWLELSTHFKLAKSSEKCYKAKILSDLYENKEIQIMLEFLKYILERVNNLNLLFQNNCANLSKVLDSLISLVHFIIKSSQNIPDNISKIDVLSWPLREENCLSHPFIGYSAEIIIKTISFESQIKIRNMCKKFLFELAVQLKQRLPSNSSVFEKMHLLNPSNIFEINKKDETKSTMYSLVHDFEKDSTKVSKICNQFNNLFLNEWRNKNDIFKFWSEVENFKDAEGDNPFEDLVQFAFKFLNLPISNAEVERVFSQMNIIKNKLRNRTGLDLLNSILIIRAWLKLTKKCCSSYHIEDELLAQMKLKKYYGVHEEDECNEILKILDCTDVNILE